MYSEKNYLTGKAKELMEIQDLPSRINQKEYIFMRILSNWKK